MRYIVLPAIVGLLFLFSSCMQEVVVGRGDTKSESRELQSATFTKVEISAPVDANISIGGASSLSFEGYANLIKLIRTEVKNNTLRIYLDEQVDFNSDKHVTANISLPSLSGLSLSGSGKLKVNGVANSTDFDVDISGSGSVDIPELHAKSLAADISGSGDLLLGGGDIQSGTFEVTGSGSVHAFGVPQQKCTVALTGSAEAEVNVAASLSAAITGSGMVKYKGHPTITENITGSGSIKDAN